MQKIAKSKLYDVAMIGNLESLSDKTVKKLSLDVDITNQPTGEEISVHQHLDHCSCKEEDTLHNS